MREVNKVFAHMNFEGQSCHCEEMNSLGYLSVATGSLVLVIPNLRWMPIRFSREITGCCRMGIKMWELSADIQR